MINLILFTGFLGTGKTTLMQNTIKAFSDKKTGVIVNEFGSVNIDSVLLKAEGIEIAELTNGSIFCACIKDKFVDSLIAMSDSEIEYLFIEASGLADPANMTQILAGISRKTGNVYDYKGSVCIVDAESFLELCQVLPAIESQLEFCSTVVINKVDLVDDIRTANVEMKIKEYNSDADIYKTSYCNVDIRKIIDKFDAGASKKVGRESTNTRENRADTFIVKAEKPVQYEMLEQFLKTLSESTYRIKGFLDTDRGAVKISTVGKNISITPWEGKKQNGELVLISSVGFKLISEITRTIEGDLKGIIHI